MENSGVQVPREGAPTRWGEALGAVFSLAGKENEDLKSWTGRVDDTFEQCQRNQLTFPAQAKGWILLHCAGLTEEQRAIKTQGQLDFEVVSQALRSCFPEAAEALAVSWSERRKEMAKLRQGRQFGFTNKEKKSFWVEVEELKKRNQMCAVEK